MGTAELHAVLSLLVHDVLGEKVPEVEADLEQFLVGDTTHLGQVGQSLESLVTQHLNLVVSLDRICQGLDEIKIIAENRRDCEGKLLRKCLKSGLLLRVLHALEFLVERATLCCLKHLLKHGAEVEAELLFHRALFVRVIKVLKGERGDLCDALDGIDTRLRRLNELADQALNQTVVEDVSVWYPGKESLQGAQTRLKQAIRNVAAHFLR